MSFFKKRKANLAIVNDDEELIDDFFGDEQENEDKKVTGILGRLLKSANRPPMDTGPRFSGRLPKRPPRPRIRPPL